MENDVKLRREYIEFRATDPNAKTIEGNNHWFSERGLRSESGFTEAGHRLLDWFDLFVRASSTRPSKQRVKAAYKQVEKFLDENYARYWRAVAEQQLLLNQNRKIDATPQEIEKFVAEHKERYWRNFSEEEAEDFMEEQGWMVRLDNDRYIHTPLYKALLKFRESEMKRLNARFEQMKYAASISEALDGIAAKPRVH